MDFKPDLSRISWAKGSFDLPSAFYKLQIPSVTTIIGDMIPDPDLEKWKQEVGEEDAKKISDAASNRGTSMHTFIEEFMKHLSRTKDVSDSLKHTQIESQKKLKEQNIPQDKIDIGRDMFYKFYYSDYASNFDQLLATELILHSKKYYYRGKLDVIYNENLYGTVISDFKTSSSAIKKDSIKEKKYKYQLGGYCIAVEDMFEEKNLKINKASIICIQTKSDLVQAVELLEDELEYYKTEFKTLVKNWHIKNGQEFLTNKII